MGFRISFVSSVNGGSRGIGSMEEIYERSKYKKDKADVSFMNVFILIKNNYYAVCTDSISLFPPR